MLIEPVKAWRFRIGLLLLLAGGLVTHANAEVPEMGTPQSIESAIVSVERDLLTSSFLLGKQDIAEPVLTSAFSPPATLSAPGNQLNGRLEIVPDASTAHARAVKDEDGRLLNTKLDIKNLPSLKVSFVMDGNDIIPLERGPQASPHPYWEWMLEPGKVWDETGDSGYSRAAIPFSLQQRNQNCMHHGMLTFLFRSSGETSRVAYQVVSETCIWLMADLWGVQEISYTPGEVVNADEVIKRNRRDTAQRIPVRNIKAIEEDHPGINAAQFEPPSPEHATIWGLVSNGVHYVGGCQTRYGTYPFCDVIDLPSYSTAKSVFGGLAYAYLELHHPGVGEEKVVDWIPECVMDDGRWRDVALHHLVNMTTGLYNSGEYMEDEDRITDTRFIQGDTHGEKVDFACRQYQRHRAPGKHWVYHTSDTYLAGLLMNRYLKQKSGVERDIFTDLLVGNLWRALGLSAVTEYSRRTYDNVAQPFTGYGLTFHPDDIVRIAQWLNETTEKNNLDSKTFATLMQGSSRNAIPPLATQGLDYRVGFWAAEASSWVGCSEPVWLPFMSGFGGITVVLLPNDMIYYYFSDSGIFLWAKAVIEAHKLRPICDV